MEGRHDERERLRAERQAAESQDAAAQLARKRRVQYLSLAAFAAAAVIVALIVISQSGGERQQQSSRPRTSRASPQVNSELEGIPQSGQTLGRFRGPGDRDRVRRPAVLRLQVLLGEGRAGADLEPRCSPAR